MRAIGRMTTYRDTEARVTLLKQCRQLRRASTDAESLLWRFLRSRQVAGAKFRRQHQFGPYILDFYCDSAKLAIEVDGSQHLSDSGVAHDAARTEYLLSKNVRVLRLWNNQVLGSLDGVISAIWDAVEEPSPQPSPMGRGSER